LSRGSALRTPIDTPADVRAFRFGAFELDLRSGELRRSGVLVRLQQQPAKVLALLAGRTGDLVTREEIQGEVWGESTFVDFEQGLNFCVKQIRSALGDQADTPRFLEKEFFSDGLTEEMITRLARLHPERLGVIARTSAKRLQEGRKGGGG
jgi:DNA-binding response OmpR family regulator